MVRPINEKIIDKLKPTAVIPLLWKPGNLDHQKLT